MNLPSSNNLTPPHEERRVLFHCCCAPCACSILERMLEAKIEVTVFLYNPNIHPKEEYKRRKEEIIRFTKKMNIPFVDADYDHQAWFKKTHGFEHEPERGERCHLCFDMRFEETARWAQEHDFKVFTSSLGISRCKDIDQVNESGQRIAAMFPGLTFWDYNWRKKGGQERMNKIIKAEQFYCQEYCGCAYSLRDANKRRVEKQQSKIETL